MSQSALLGNIGNPANGVAIAAALDANFQALASWNAGASEPSPTYPNMRWADANTGLLKIRNAADTDWVTIAIWNGLSTYTPYFGGQPLTSAATVKHKLDATADPAAANDSSQGYTIGSLWLNTAATLGRNWFRCRSAAIGAAVWDAIAPGGNATAAKDGAVPAPSAGDITARRALLADMTYGTPPLQKLGDINMSTGVLISSAIGTAKTLLLRATACLPTTASRGIWVVLYKNGLAQVGAGSYAWNFTGLAGSGPNSSSDTKIRMTDYDLPGAGAPRNAMTGDIGLRNGAATSAWWNLAYIGSSSVVRADKGAAFCIGFDGPINGIKVVPVSSGGVEDTWAGGSIAVFGLSDY